MTSFICIHQNTMALIPIGGNVIVSRKLILFLKKQGPSNGVAASAINKSDLFVDNLVSSRRHHVCKSSHVIGEELTTPQISKDVLPCPELLHEDHGGTPVDVIENFPDLPDTETKVLPLPATQQHGRRDSKKLRAVTQVSEAGPSGTLPPHVTYLIEEIGLDLEQIKVMARKYPHFAHLSLERNIMPLIEFLLDLGVAKSKISSIVCKCPQLCGLRLSENIIPKMKFLETLGVDKTKWGKVITRFPPFFTVSQQKVEATVEFLYEMGLTEELIGKLITGCPVIIGLSIEDQLRPKAEYFQSLGFDVAVLLRRCPQLMGLSLEAKLVPKWEFFLTMDYSRSDLLKHPKYFSYSLEERIKPRYNLMKAFGVKLTLFQLLIPNHNEFEVLLRRRLRNCG